MIDSRISGFYRMAIDERLDELLQRGIIDAETAKRLRNSKGLLSLDVADRMVENVIGVFGLPLAVAPNFLVNDRDYVVPMVTEEPSVVAAVSAAAMLVRNSGGFTATSTEPVTIGQIHLHDLADEQAAVKRIAAAEAELVALANELQPGLVERGGGAIGLEIRRLQLADGRNTLALHLLVDTRDAMGANLVNTMCEGIADRVAELGGGTAVLKILSNLADRSMISASTRIPVEHLGAEGAKLRDAIVASSLISLGWDLYQFYFPIYGHSIGLAPSTIGTIISTFALAVFSIRIALPRLARKYTEFELLLYGIAFSGAALLLFPLFRDPYVCLMRADHPDIGRKLTKKQFLSASHALVSYKGGHRVIEEALERAGLSRKIALRVPHFTVLPMVLERSDLVLILPAKIARVYERQGGFKFLPLPVPIPPADVAAHWHERFERDPGNRWLRETIMELFTE